MLLCSISQIMDCHSLMDDVLLCQQNVFLFLLGGTLLFWLSSLQMSKVQKFCNRPRSLPSVTLCARLWYFVYIFFESLYVNA